MSYILDSLKKSDKERRSIDHSASAVMHAPPFLENDKPASSNKWLILFSVVVGAAALAYYFFPFSESKPALSTTNKLAEVKPASSPQAVLRAAPVVKATPASSKEKEQAVLLYKQALANKSRPEVDSLYQKLNEKEETGEAASAAAVEQTAAVSEAAAVLETESETEPADLNLEAVEPEVLAEAEPQESAQAESRIPSIYDIDAYIRKTIPSVDYGAHIYATDNNSGFVILDGARRRAGDKLSSGLYVEKIEEESVVLSYEGTLFSLPAMKSWEGK